MVDILSFPWLQLEETRISQPNKHPNYQKIISVGAIGDLTEYKSILNNISEKSKKFNEQDLNHVLKAAAEEFDTIASIKIADLEREFARQKSQVRQERPRSLQSPFSSSGLGLDPSEIYEVPRGSSASGKDNRDSVTSVQKMHKKIKGQTLRSQAQQHRREMQTALSLLRKELDERASLEIERMERDQKVEMDLLRRDLTAFYDRQLRNLNLEVTEYDLIYTKFLRT